MQFTARTDARHLPSRHRFALFRLAAFLRLRGARPVSDPTRLYFVDRDQSAFEQYAIAAWVFSTTAGLLCAALTRAWPWWAAFPVAMVLAGLSLQLPVVVLGVVFTLLERLTGRTMNRMQLISRFTLAVVMVASALSFQSSSWPRWVGAQFLGLVAANGLAAAVMLLLRRRVITLEQELRRE